MSAHAFPFTFGIESADTTPNINSYSRRYVVMILVATSTNAIYLLLIFAIDVFNGISVCSIGYGVVPHSVIIRYCPHPATFFVVMTS